MGPSVQQMELSVEEPTPFVLVDGAVLRENPGQQTLLIRDEGDIFAAYGRTADMQAWLADASYTAIDLDDEGAPVSTVVEPTVVAGEEDGADADAADGSTDADAEEPGRNPEGSDLWLDSFVEQDQMITDMQLPEGMSVLIAKDGTEPAPSDIVVSWPLNTSTPWVGPLITAGGAVLLFGLVMYVLAIRHQRRGRGPRRKGPGPLPATEPIDLAVDSATIREALPPKEEQDPAATEPETPESAEEPTVQKPEKTERRAAPMRRRLLVLPALGLAGLLFAGCSSDSWPQFGEATPTPTPTPTVITPENQKPPAVTEAQASRILQDISATLEEADAAMDIDLAATRLEGLALDARKTDYALRKSLTDRPLPAVIPTDAIEVLLPQATDAWPRTVLVLSKSKSDDTAPPVILTMTQADPWSDYKVTDIAEMQASTEVPQLAPAWLGTSVITENAAAFLTLAPDEIAAAFADVVDSGEESEYYSAFDPVTIALAESIISSRDAVTQALVDNGAAETSSASFDIEPTDQPPVALATLDSGAIVAVSLVDSESITPTSDDAVIRFGDNAEAKTLTGAEEASKGVVTTYGLQLFFSVPSQGSTEQIRLLAVHQDILNVEVIK
nr:glycosyl transferase [Microbacterium ginsengiterrae]